jgi:hypothetical protein
VFELLFWDPAVFLDDNNLVACVYEETGHGGDVFLDLIDVLYSSKPYHLVDSGSNSNAKTNNMLKFVGLLKRSDSLPCLSKLRRTIAGSDDDSHRWHFLAYDSKIVDTDIIAFQPLIVRTTAHPSKINVKTEAVNNEQDFVNVLVTVKMFAASNDGDDGDRLLPVLMSHMARNYIDSRLHDHDFSLSLSKCSLSVVVDSSSRQIFDADVIDDLNLFNGMFMIHDHQKNELLKLERG